MKAIYGKHVRAEFTAAMARHFPQFEPFRVRLTKEERWRTATPFSGERVFRWRASERLHCFIVMSPHPKQDEFFVHAGWSTRGRFAFDLPWPPARTFEDEEEFALDECLIGFGLLYRRERGTFAQGHDKWSVWEPSVDIFHPDYVRIAVAEDMVPVSEEQALTRARRAVGDAIAAIRDIVVPYLERRAARDAGRVEPPDPFSEARDEFTVRYYRWAQQDARRELEEGFPLVRAIKGGLARRFLAHASALSPGDQARLSVALVKRAHRRAVRLTGESLDPEETELAERYVHAARDMSLPEDATAYRPWQSGPGQASWDRRRFLSQIRGVLAPELGPGAEPLRSRDEWRWENRVADWAIRTTVEAGVILAPLRYFHTVGAAASEARRLRDDISVLSWLGIGRQTLWDLITEADVADSGESLRAVCQHFLGAVPGLVRDLSPREPAGKDAARP